MLTNILFSDSKTPYRDIQHLAHLIEGNKIFKNYDLALFILPTYYNFEVAKNFLNKFFGEKPFIAFYSTFVGSNNFFTTEGLVGLFLKGEKKPLTYSINVFDNLLSLENFLESHPEAAHLIFIPYPFRRFAENFNYFKEITVKETPVSGLITGGMDYNGIYPVIVNDSVVNDGSVAVLSLEEGKACLRSTINFKKLGPPFSFTASKGYLMETVDDQPAVEFFRTILNKFGMDVLKADYLTGFPMLIKNQEEEVEFNKLIRFPKEEEEGNIAFWANLPTRGFFHFTYLLSDRSKIKNILKKHCDLYPVADLGLFFLCVGKSIFLNLEEELKFLRKRLQFPFLVVGSYGELCTYRNRLWILNGSTTFVLIKT